MYRTCPAFERHPLVEHANSQGWCRSARRYLAAGDFMDGSGLHELTISISRFQAELPAGFVGNGM
jgi:hypothetical protein